MTESDSKVFLVTGNEDMRNKNIFLENLLYYKKQKGESPLLIDLILKNNCFTGEPAKKENKPKTEGFFDYYTDILIPYINGERLVSELNGKNSKELIDIEQTFTSTFILGAFPQESKSFYDCIDHIVFIIKNEYESSSYLFNFINNLYDKMIEKNISIIISGTKKIEDAAQVFVKIRDEMKRMIDDSLTFDFIGSLSYDIPKITFARKKNEVYLKVFENDIFHGDIKFINDKLLGLEFYRLESFFKAIAEYHKT